ncbi:tetratricopeptide repeat protein [Streptomyces sp. NPDC059454]|uniref:tetratricopeptide repeat protein n=1 Tax=Streptomyces sp. NPDC059454 TaxID=3346836 RepID=UPI0036D1E15E
MSSSSTEADNSAILIGSPPREADCFQERKESERLALELASADAVPEACFLIGGGGVGKTQIAARYVRERLNERSVDVVVWASASSRDSVQYSYAEAIHALTGADASDAEGASARFLAWAHTTDKKWLVVLDDLTTPSTLKGLWPPSSKSGRVLVTTRRRDAALSAARWRRIPVDIFRADDSVSYLTEKLSVCGIIESPQELLNLADDLDHLPLALAQSAAYLIDSGLECSQYRELLADRRRTLREILPDQESLPDDHSDIVTATWSLSMEQANSLTPHGVARPLLQIAAVLSPNGIPRRVFATSAVREYLRSFIDGMTEEHLTEAHVKAALRNLHRLSLLDDNSAALPGSEVSVHALVQRAVVETLSEETYHTTIQAAADSLLEAWPESPLQSDYIRALRTNAEFMRDNFLPRLLSDYCHELLCRHGESLIAAGLASAAVDHFEILRSAVTAIDPSRPDLTFLRVSLGDALEEAGQTTKALREYREVLNDELEHRGKDDGWVLHIWSSLAECLGRAGDAKGSVREFEKLLMERIRVNGPDHEYTFDTRRRLVVARSRAGDIPGAIATCEELLEDELRVHGRDHRHTWHTQTHLADEIGASGDVTTAIEILEGVLRQITRQYGEHHEETFSVRRHLAQWYAEDERYKVAIETVQSLLQDEQAAFGESHPRVLDLQSDLADYIGVASDPSRALEIARDVYEKHLSELGPEHPETLDARGLVAHWKGRSGNWQEAAREYETLLKDCEHILGPDHLMTVRMVMLLASALRNTGDLRGALSSYQRLARDRERIHGSDDPRTLKARDYLAYHLHFMGEREKALEAFKQVHLDQVRLLGEDHPDTLHTREHIEDLEI